MPSKRVSLKGKGADLFFGGEHAVESSPPDPAPTELPPTPPVLDPEQTEREPESTDADSTPTFTSPERPRRRSPRVPTSNGSGADSRDMSPPVDNPKPSDVRRGTDENASVNQASMLASFDKETIESIRKVVKVVGRDVSFVRLSSEEKRRLAAIVFTYKMQGVKTSENEINRIAINLLLDDFDRNGDVSVLAQVLAALQA